MLVTFAGFDPLGRPTITAGSDHCFHTCCPSVFLKSTKTTHISSEAMFTTGEIVGMDEWIMGDICSFFHFTKFQSITNDCFIASNLLVVTTNLTYEVEFQDGF